MACFISACASPDDYHAQNRWLQQNFPDRAQQLDNTNNSHNYFREDVLAGHVQLGMYIDEVLIATDTAPYGPKRFKGRFWCDNQLVNRCNKNCDRCDGIVFSKKDLLVFSGRHQEPVVVDIQSISDNSSIFHIKSAKFTIAEALYNNRIVTGMSANEVERVLHNTDKQVTYICDNNHIIDKQSCRKYCTLCKILTTHDLNNSRMVKTIYLGGDTAAKTVTKIEHETLVRP